MKEYKCVAMKINYFRSPGGEKLSFLIHFLFVSVPVKTRTESSTLSALFRHHYPTRAIIHAWSEGTSRAEVNKIWGKVAFHSRAPLSTRVLVFSVELR